MVVAKKQSTLFNGDTVDMVDVNGEASEPEPEPESESEDEDVKLTEASKNSINNRDGLLEKLADISWPDNVEWIHKLSIDIDREQEVDVNDDLARELSFYTQALEGARQAFGKLQSIGLPFLRPPDYYAEMVKTDAHMVKVKGRLLVEKRKIEEAEERRKAREAKKIAKEVQSQKLKERAKQKKDDIESVQKWRKQRQQSGFAGGDKDGEMGFSFEDENVFERSNKRRPGVAPGDRSGGKAGHRGGMGKKGGDKNRKDRNYKNSKFGFGGRKGLKKQNTAETTNELRGFSKGNFSGNKKRKR
ncbi:probable rRNA-processing protein EBP2 homolog [Telopea speciosissima]|uniref:probable rRNA-processing protein EBP2 homolog n=1 Tax=Telopea speciosissima TaxID=54955 RepID=UPI001CC3B8BD|nr:probable rRNA-processing protein EBP2 homolog [Telopea speciosissima]